jgi:hypothetical protein
MEVGGRDKIMPSHSLRKVLNPLQEGIVKIQRFRKPTQKVYKAGYLRRPHNLKPGRGIDKDLEEDWQTIKGKLKGLR